MPDGTEATPEKVATYEANMATPLLPHAPPPPGVPLAAVGKAPGESNNPGPRPANAMNETPETISLRQGAENGDADAQFNLGCRYAFGQGVPKDDEEAVKWYRRSAEQGYANAQYNLGCRYEKGQGVPKDDEEAVKWYRRAAEQGNAIAQAKLGVCYEMGQGVPKDVEEAVKWYRRAAEQGNAIAQYNLGLCYANGKGVPKDEAEAAKWYRKAAEQGGGEAQCNLGNCYYQGKGVPKDEEEAVKWYRRAAEQGNVGAHCNLGNCYAHGKGVPQDDDEAAKWWRKAAEQGNSFGQFEIGVRYCKGKGVPKVDILGYMWLNLSAMAGNGDAAKELERQKIGMSPWKVAMAERLGGEWKSQKEAAGVLEPAPAVNTTTKTGNAPAKTLTIDRARAIVEHAEDEYATGRHIEYSFTPFEAGGAVSPLEAHRALFIVIAHHFWYACVRQSGTAAAMKLFDEYAALSEHISMSLFFESTELPYNAAHLSPEIIAGLKATETVESFVSFLRTLRPQSPDYWRQVYPRLGMDYGTAEYQWVIENMVPQGEPDPVNTDPVSDMEPRIQEMNPQQLQAALELENVRITAANHVRNKIQMSVFLFGFLGFFIWMGCLENHVVTFSQSTWPILLFALLGALVYWLSEPRALHHIDTSSAYGQEKAREVLGRAHREEEGLRELSSWKTDRTSSYGRSDR